MSAEIPILFGGRIPVTYKQTIRCEVTSGLGYSEERRPDSANEGWDSNVDVQIHLGELDNAAHEKRDIDILGILQRSKVVTFGSNVGYQRSLLTNAMSDVQSRRKRMGKVSSFLHKVFRPLETPEQILKEAKRLRREYDRDRMSGDF